MLRRLRSYATFSNVVAMLALFMALGGTSYAALKIGSKQIRNNSVKSVDIRNNGVRGKDIRDATITGRDIAPGVIGGELKASAAEARRDSGPTNIPASQNFTTVATLSGLEPGAYYISAKVNQGSDVVAQGRCRLSTENDYDDSSQGLRAHGAATGHNLQIIHTFTSAGAAVLACRSTAGNWSATDTKVIAIHLGAARTSIVSG